MLKTAVARLREVSAHLNGRIASYRHRLPYYVVDGANWAIDSEGEYIARGIRSQFGVDCRTLRDLRRLSFLYRQVVHFGSQYLFTSGRHSAVHSSNRVVVTFFHGDSADAAFADAVSTFQRQLGRIDRVIVPCRIMAERMTEWGVPADKVVLIPIGVDLESFRLPLADERNAARRGLQIPPGHVVIGSFQKDGVGWGDGLEPKMIKGPDVFLQVIDQLRKHAPIFVLLTGPARGYVRRGLDRMQVAHHHCYLKRYVDVAPYYHALDLYLITSREEGGPKAVMESMATGVPLVSTRVGMAADLIQDGINGFLCEIDDPAKLTSRALQLIADDELRRQIRVTAQQTVLGCDFSVVARQHHEQIYEPLLRTLV